MAAIFHMLSSAYLHARTMPSATRAHVHNGINVYVTNFLRQLQCFDILLIYLEHNDVKRNLSSSRPAL